MPKVSEHIYTERTEIKVDNPKHLKDNYVTVVIDGEKHSFPQVVAEDLRDKLEENVVDEEYGYLNMQKQLDEANSRIEELEYKLQHLGLSEAV